MTLMKSLPRTAMLIAVGAAFCLPNLGCGPPRPPAAAPPPPPLPPTYVQPAAAWIAPQLPAAQVSGAGTISGAVRGYNYGPGGLDGLILDSGTVVHFPPELSNQVTAVVPIGSTVVVEGWPHIGPAGDSLVDAQIITNRSTNGSIRVADQATPPPPGPPPRRGRPVPPPPPPLYSAPSVAPATVASAAPLAPQGAAAWTNRIPQSTETTLTGTVRSFNYGPDGQVNGLLLDQGTVVFFPPDLASQVTQVIPVRGRVRIRGWLRPDAAGGARLLDAETIVNRSSGVAITMPPAPRP